MSMIELLPPPLKRAFYTPEQRHAVVTFRVAGSWDCKVRSGLHANYGRINAKGIQPRHPGFRMKLRGRCDLAMEESVSDRD
ncbi:MAG: hypothetical protein U0936_06955 [Planctomycetaceae bacterium]